MNDSACGSTIAAERTRWCAGSAPGGVVPSSRSASTAFRSFWRALMIPVSVETSRSFSRLTIGPRHTELAVHRMVAAGRHHREARHHPGRDPPVVVAVLGVPACADVEPAVCLRDLEERAQVVQVVLVALRALEERVALQAAGV